MTKISCDLCYFWSPELQKCVWKDTDNAASDCEDFADIREKENYDLLKNVSPCDPRLYQIKPREE